MRTTMMLPTLPVMIKILKKNARKFKMCTLRDRRTTMILPLFNKIKTNAYVPVPVS